MSAERICVLGGGAWGTALALTAARAGNAVALWARDAAAAAEITAGANAKFLPGIAFEPGLDVGSELGAALSGANCVLVATPAQALRGVLAAAAAHLEAGATLVLCAKGIETGSGKLLSQIAAELCPAHASATLSGPSFAADVARGLPTAVVIAAAAEAGAAAIAARLSTPRFRCYSTADQAGVEVGGALKNVIAIAAGAAIGAGFGASAQAALVTRGFVELRRMAELFGAQPETLMGLSGLGDLMLTCASSQSRNYSYGLALGRGEALAGRPLAEGVATAAIASRIARERGVAAPITHAVAEILAGRMTIGEAVTALMSRPLRTEADG